MSLTVAEEMDKLFKWELGGELTPIDVDPDVVDLDNRPVTPDNVDITIDIQHPRENDEQGSVVPTLPGTTVTEEAENGGTINNLYAKYTRFYDTKKLDDYVYDRACTALRDEVNSSNSNIQSKMKYGVASAKAVRDFLEGRRPRIVFAAYKDPEFLAKQDIEYRKGFTRSVMLPILRNVADSLRYTDKSHMKLIYRGTSARAQFILERETRDNSAAESEHVSSMLSNGVNVILDIMPIGHGHYRVVSMEEEVPSADSEVVPTESVPIDVGVVPNDISVEDDQDRAQLFSLIQERLHCKYPELKEKVYIQYTLTPKASRRWSYMTNQPTLPGIECYGGSMPHDSLPRSYGDTRAYSEVGLNELHMAIYDLHSYLNLSDKYLEAGNEGFFDFLRGVGNIIGHVVNLAATGLFRGWRDFKRSELEEFCDSNVFSVKAIYAGDYNLVRDMKVDLPIGMKGTYQNAVDVLTDYLNYLDMSARSKELGKLMLTIYDDVKDGDINMSRHTATVNQKLIPQDVRTRFEKLNKIFTDDKNDTDTFGKQFSSMTAYRSLIQKVLSADSYLRAVSGVYSNLEWINSIVCNAVALYEKKKDDPGVKENAKQLVTIVKAVAELFDTYSICVNDLSRIGHNLTLVMMRLREEFKV